MAFLLGIQETESGRVGERSGEVGSNYINQGSFTDVMTYKISVVDPALKGREWSPGLFNRTPIYVDVGSSQSVVRVNK